MQECLITIQTDFFGEQRSMELTAVSYTHLVYEEEKYSIGIPTVLYKELLPIAEGKEENLLDEFLEKISSKETYLLDIVPDEARQHILHVK